MGRLRCAASSVALYATLDAADGGGAPLFPKEDSSAAARCLLHCTAERKLQAGWAYELGHLAQSFWRGILLPHTLSLYADESERTALPLRPQE